MNIRVLIFLLTIPVTAVCGNSWYVSVAGGGNGTFTKPWSLHTAFAGNSSIQAGDTVYIRGGVYRRSSWYIYENSGTADFPVIYRNYKNERVSITDTSTASAQAIYFQTKHVWLWGLEITWSSLDTLANVDGIRQYIDADSIRIINCIIHDFTTGMAIQEGDGWEVNGSIFYYNGRWAYSNHGYHIYCNYPSPPYVVIPNKFRHNIFRDSYSTYAFHGYTQGGQVDSVYLAHNVFMNTHGKNPPTLLFRNDTISGCRVDTNYWFFSGDSTRNLYWENKPAHGSRIRGNYIVGGITDWRWLSWDRVFSGNEYVGAFPEITDTTGYPKPMDTTSYPNNAYYILPNKPTINRVIIEPNEYENKRAHIIIYNWEARDSIDVDLSSILNNGDKYIIRDIQNYWGGLITSKFNGSLIRLPMILTNIDLALPHYAAGGTPVHTKKIFNVFLVNGVIGEPK